MLEIEELIELKNKLTNGMVFKSYRALCENMKWKPTGGDTKVANMKKLDSVCLSQHIVVICYGSPRKLIQ